jgi:hypothetical protein
MHIEVWQGFHEENGRRQLPKSFISTSKANWQWWNAPSSPMGAGSLAARILFTVENRRWR